MIVPVSTLRRIRQKVGPSRSEGIWQILRPAPAQAIKGGFGKPSKVLDGVSGGRLRPVFTLTNDESLRAFLARFDADYVLALEAWTDIKATDIVREWGVEWKARLRINEGTRLVRPNIDRLYECIAPGNLGQSEPASWPLIEGEEVTAGTAVLRCMGTPPEYEVRAILGPGTYGDQISRRVAVKKRQI